MNNNNSNQKLLVVLDVNGTILASSHQQRPNVRVDARARFKYVYFRPGMREFIDWLFSQSNIIDVAIWTSNITENALAIIDLICTPAQRDRLRLVYTRSQCTIGKNYASCKELSRLWKAGFRESHTIIVDDSEDKIVPSSSPAWYRIPTFEPGRGDVDDHNALGELRRHIEATLARLNIITAETD